MRTNLEDLTFLIPVRLDSIVRLENLIAVIKYIRHSFKTNIMVLEAAPNNNRIIERLLDRKVEYYYIEDKDPIFYRTMYLNKMVGMSSTPFLAIWDTDVLVHKKQILAAIDSLRSEHYEIAYPYDGSFLDTSYIIRDLFLKKSSISVLMRNKSKMYPIYGTLMFGGAFMVNKCKYIQAGMENERFYGWGNEDYERFERFRVLRYNIFRSKGSLFHLTHPRNIHNSKFRSQKERMKSRAILATVRSCSEDEVRDLVQSQSER